MASKKAARKGKRYSPEEKREVVDFVNRYNAAKRKELDALEARFQKLKAGL